MSLRRVFKMVLPMFLMTVAVDLRLIFGTGFRSKQYFLS
jgi:hypothetical protein